MSDGENRLLQELFLARLTQLGSNPTEADLMGLLDENWDCASQATVGIPPELSFTPTSDTSTEEMVRSTTSSDKSIGSLEPASLTPISVAKNVVKFDALAEVNSKIVYDTPKKKRKLRSDSTNGENDNWILQAIESHKCFVVLTRLTPSKMRFLSLTS